MKVYHAPPVLLFLFLVLSIGARVIVPQIISLPPLFVWIGAVFVVAGVVLNLWADNLFKMAKTTVKPYLSPTTLVTAGPFRISRNPMYLGMFLILVGVALMTNIIELAVPLVFFVLINTRVIPREEVAMGQAFGEQYRTYARSVRRWL